MHKLGKKVTKNGGTDGHLFRFTKDERESLRRRQRIQELWDFIVERDGENARWSPASLPIAKAFEEGEVQVVLKRPVGGPDQYARDVNQMVALFPNITFVPEDAKWYDEGAKLEKLCIDNQITKIRLHAAKFYRLPPNDSLLVTTTQATVAQALDSFEKHIKSTMLVNPDLEEGLDGKRLSDTAIQYCKNLDRIRVQNASQLDWPLSRLTFQGCDAMLQVWRDRPLKEDGISQMAVKTCNEHGKRLMAFFRWLSKADEFEWKKPTDFDLLKLNIRRTNAEKSASIRKMQMQVQPFTEDEVRILNEYALPFERFLLLCGLNLGFKRMECATLRVDEVRFREMHECAKYIDFEFSSGDSFVRRLRTKTGVFSEWILWPLTVQAMEWAISHRKKQTHILGGDGRGRAIPCGPDALMLLNDKGHSFTKQTKNGNSNQQITNTWTHLLDRVQVDHKDFPRLPHENLRDTSANWIRAEFGGEIADVFLAMDHRSGPVV